LFFQSETKRRQLKDCNRARRHRLKSVPLDEHYGLGTWDVEALAATTTGEHVVHTNHVVTRVLESQAILFAGAAGQRLLLGPPEPAHFVLAALAAVRTRKRRAFRFLFFVKEVSFIHRIVVTPPVRCPERFCYRFSLRKSFSPISFDSAFSICCRHTLGHVLS